MTFYLETYVRTPNRNSKVANNVCSKCAKLLEILQKIYNVYVAGNSRNQAFPEMPRQFWKCLKFLQLLRQFWEFCVCYLNFNSFKFWETAQHQGKNYIKLT